MLMSKLTLILLKLNVRNFRPW